MIKFICTFLFVLSSAVVFAQKENCEDKQHPMPVLSDSVRKIYQANLVSAEKKYKSSNINEDHIIWYGRRLAYLGNYKEAVDIYTKGIELFPSNARLYRHRGHRYITLPCFDTAIKDLKKAADLIKD